MKKLSLCLTLFFTLSVIVAGQTPSPSPTQPIAQDDDDVVKISTDLVQIDATVTDKSGKVIKDLSINDFEILQDGKPQKITNFSFINLESAKRPTTTSANKKDEKTPEVFVPSKVRPENVRRILTFIVDDGNCSATQGGMLSAKTGIEIFVKEQMQNDDLVAIYRTRRGSSTLQQYTADKNRLLQIAKSIRWYPPQLGCTNNSTGGDFEGVRSDSTLGSGQPTFGTDASRAGDKKLVELGRETQVIGTVGVLRYVVNGLKSVTGRKSVFFMSDGLPLSGVDGGYGRDLDSARELIDAANRASVVFQTIDIRGISDSSFIAAEDFVDSGAQDGVMVNSEIDKTRKSRTTEATSLQNGMIFLAAETGGKFHRGSNEIGDLVNRALISEGGYYLFGYEPEEGTFKGKKFHKIEIKAKKEGLNVRSRSGFLSVTDESLIPKNKTAQSDLYRALIAPLPGAGLDVRLTVFYGNTAEVGSFVRAFFHLGGDSLTFADEPNGMKKASFDVVAVTLNEKNEVIEEFNKTHTIRFPAASAAGIKQNGIIYSTDMPLKKSGIYTFRVAVRDVEGKQIGTAGQLIDVPNLAKNKLFLSGLTVDALIVKEGKPQSLIPFKVENGFVPVANFSNSVTRRFARGSILAYNYVLYNAQKDKTSGQPKLTVQVKLFREGQVVADGQPQPAQLELQTDLTRIKDFGYLRLNPDLPTGEYALQIIIRDTLSNDTTSQFIDFEVTQ